MILRQQWPPRRLRDRNVCRCTWRKRLLVLVRSNPGATEHETRARRVQNADEHEGGPCMTTAAERMSFPGVIDADGHILEPPDLWERYSDPQYRDRAIR